MSRGQREPVAAPWCRELCVCTQSGWEHGSRQDSLDLAVVLGWFPGQRGLGEASTAALSSREQSPGPEVTCVPHLAPSSVWTELSCLRAGRDWEQGWGQSKASLSH